MEIESLFAAAIEVKAPIVLWKLPGEKKINGLMELSGKTSFTRIEFKKNQVGFAFSPFLNPDGKKTIFLQADLTFNTSSKELVEHQGMKRHVEKQQRGKELRKVLNDLLSQSEAVPLRWHNGISPPKTQTDKEGYCKLVANGVKAIRKQQFKKLVLSRTKLVPLTDRFNVTKFFQKLCAVYPGAFVSLISVPDIGTWMGASPEILVRISKDHIFHTVSLAGTQMVGNGLSPSRELVWTKKEFEEQAWVTHYIMNCFRRMGLRKFDQEGPRTVRAGNLFHLRTDFIADLNPLNLRNFGSRMLRSLHPTPAVCGLPKRKALAYIIENEGYDRQFYTGFLGPVNIENESHLYVNLRCVQLYKSQAILYVGAGITRESIPEKEWQETEMKCDTILRVMAS